MIIASMITQLVFFAFSAVLLISSMMVTLTNRSVHAVLWLILAFVATAGLWILIEAEFLGLILIIVYVGAVMTLFLFVVMMLNLGEEGTRKRSYKSWISFGAVFLVMIVLLFLLLMAPNYTGVAAPAATSESNLVSLGLALFREDALSVELAAVLLLVAIVGAIYLTHREHTSRKKQDISAQIKVTKKERLKIVSMVSEKPNK